ncbi:hypothetical protein [Salinarimonas chemoclinalis]|uniref:hypothetical protein n=1 Tax=Salinarimonas chemoclinalis TaxID=3241599 RepID=UPI0035571730
MRTMNFAKLTPIVAILALAACDNEPTTAEAPVIVEEETAIVEQQAPAVEQESAAVDPLATQPGTDVTAIEPRAGTAAGTDTAATEIEPIVEGGGEAEVTVITPDAGSQTTAQATGTGTELGAGTTTESTGAISATTATMIDPGTYTSDQLSLELAEGGTFTLTGPDGNAVEGDWRVFDDTLTLTNVEGVTGDASFPMTCTIDEEGEGFRISAQTSSCEMLDGQVFQPQG